MKTANLYRTYGAMKSTVVAHMAIDVDVRGFCSQSVYSLMTGVRTNDSRARYKVIQRLSQAA